MNDNPYAAPKAHVTDIEHPAVARVRPPQIKLVMQIAAANYLLGIGVLITNWQFYSERGGIAVLIASQAAGLALAVWLYYKIWQGRNWARIVFLVFSLFGMAMTLTSFYKLALAPMPATIKWMAGVGVVISIVVIYLLFLSPGREWFAKRNTDAPA